MWGGERSRACLGKFLEKNATLTVKVMSVIKYFNVCHHLTVSYLCKPRALIYETPALDEVERHNKGTEPTNCSTDHTCHANPACSWSTSSPLFRDVLLLCPVARPLAITAAQLSESWALLTHWQSEFHSLPYTRRPLWRSARIYALPLFPAGCPGSSLLMQKVLQRGFYMLRGGGSGINRHLKHLTVFGVRNG